MYYVPKTYLISEANIEVGEGGVGGGGYRW